VHAFLISGGFDELVNVSPAIFDVYWKCRVVFDRMPLCPGMAQLLNTHIEKLAAA
jgi:hypothetical protein